MALAQETTRFVGAEIFIEPGQSPEMIETWFKSMHEAGMPVTRIRLFEKYMRDANGNWDFTLFDFAYTTADKYNIKIYGNLFPMTSFEDVGGLKLPCDEDQLKSIAEYVKQVVNHFKKYKSCYGWVPINEPGVGMLPRDSFTQDKFKIWKLNKTTSSHSIPYQHFNFLENQFLLEYNTWFLQWITSEIRKYDSQNLIHVNNHAIFENAAEYDFPSWRKFLSSLGGSAHASWHFKYFTRSQYALAVSANAEMLRSGAGPIPWFMTELQGGNNTYSGYNPVCPTPEEISQWLWLTMASESQGAIFWCLNPRASGFEAGEWALLNYQHQPTDRFNSAKDVMNTLNKFNTLFSSAKSAESGINIIYVRESLWMERKMQNGSLINEARNPGGVMKSVLAYYEVLSGMGIQSNLKEISEFDFDKPNFSGMSIILSNQISIPRHYIAKLYEFVNKGGQLWIDGLTGYYDEVGVCLPVTSNEFNRLVGAQIKEYKHINKSLEININETELFFPPDLWYGSLIPTTGTAAGVYEKDIISIHNQIGNGQVIFTPAFIGLAARLQNNYKPLSALISDLIIPKLGPLPVQLEKYYPNIICKTLSTNKSLITIIVNKSQKKESLKFQFSKKRNPQVIQKNKSGRVKNTHVKIDPEETIVIVWEEQ